jgi:hypothetical protein
MRHLFSRKQQDRIHDLADSLEVTYLSALGKWLIEIPDPVYGKFTYLYDSESAARYALNGMQSVLGTLHRMTVED